ncbi:ImmA/IrrE family metallo-endopeptidase [Bifidobacterium bifidum]|uniref:ImmA/IrrE family metallo-endopeptidase n=1 Tax=Bifidobacterium bifidum TaxID=1681 RepID=UPI001C21CA1B|nr:ImmA/IrrE family metallo-endopeptidase [Bifidobacterium bifidum]MBU8982801.1 ImmA/IrrE family metallo-endopeptidase [Bifidobacterium bifidum]MBU8986588.1 ImmA/IrrE family metallo-endopeptidase [Bifidobacterium bifidum]
MALLSRERQIEIEEAVVEIFQDMGIKPNYPMRVGPVARALGIKVVPYSSLSEEEKELARAASGDAFHIRTSDYTDARLVVDDTCGAYFNRSRFSGGHELGHIWLGHEEGQPNIEGEADYFSGYFLVPHPLVLATPKDANLAEIFGVSWDCANYARDQAEKRRKEGSWRPHEQWLLDNATWKGGGLLSQM